MTDPSAEMWEVLAELVRLKNRLSAVEVAFERARAILSAQPETCAHVRFITKVRRDAAIHEQEGDYNKGFAHGVAWALDWIDPEGEFAKLDAIVSQPSTTSEKEE